MIISNYESKASEFILQSLVNSTIWIGGSIYFSKLGK